MQVNTPAVGVPQVNPRLVSSTALVKVVLAGIVSVTTTFCAVSGPLLAMKILNKLPEPEET